MIQIKNLSKSFGERRVLHEINLEFGEGESIFILGKSGVGKSVLLKHIVGLIEADEGEIWVGSLKVDTQKKNELSQIRQICGLVFQFPALLDSYTVFENVALGMRSRGGVKEEAALRSQVAEKLSWVGLSLSGRVGAGGWSEPSLGERFPPVLSFGTQKRISIARALACEPKYLLFDEPTTGLDPVATAMLNALIRKLSRELGVATVVVSHDIKSALAVADKVLFLDGGRVVFQGTPEEARQSQVPIVLAFLKSYRLT